MKIQKLILPMLGLLFAGVGAVVVWFFVPWFNQAAAQIEQLSPLTAASLAEAPLGQESLIEGRISERNPTHFHLFVAYVRQEYRGEDDDKKSIWVEDERVTPPLLLDLPGGRVQIANDNYSLRGQQVRWQSDAHLTWHYSIGSGTKSYAGFERGNPVLALGEVVEGPGGREFQADWLYGGTRASYIEDQYNSVVIARWVGLTFLGVGIIVFGLGVWVWLRLGN